MAKQFSDVAYEKQVKALNRMVTELCEFTTKSYYIIFTTNPRGKDEALLVEACTQHVVIRDTDLPMMLIRISAMLDLAKEEDAIISRA